MVSRDHRRSQGKLDRTQAAGDRTKKLRARDDLRARIAFVAAKLIAEGVPDYHVAKLKAARQLGAIDAQSLPDNREIEAALREHMSLFQAESQPAALLALRQTALRVMHRLDRFLPWLSGAILNGTANEFSAIELELVGVEPKTFELFLLNETIAFQIRDPAKQKGRSFTLLYEFEYDDIPVQVVLFDSHMQRQSAYPQESVRHARVRFEEARALFEATPKP